MRRFVTIVLVVGLMGMAIAVSATETANYKDKFSSIGWGGSDGSMSWSGPWSEIGDDGDETKGNVRVVSSGNCASGNCMRMSALTTLLGAIGAVRSADTSDLEDASLSFDLKATPSLLGSQLQVQVNGGGGWVTVVQYQLGGGVNDHPTIDVSDYGSENFRVRFLFTGLLLSSEAFIDNIEVLGTIVEEPTTTTTTVAQTTTTSPTTTSTTRAPSSTTSTTQPPETTTTIGGSTEGTAGPTTSTTSTSTTLSTSSSTTTTTTLAVGSGGPGGPGSPLPPTSTSTTISTAEAIGGPGSGVGGTVPNTTGIRASARGLQADFQGDLYGDIRTVSSLNGVDVQADYNMAVEVIESSWAWMVLLGLLVAYSIITGLDRRRRTDT